MGLDRQIRPSEEERKQRIRRGSVSKGGGVAGGDRDEDALSTGKLQGQAAMHNAKGMISYESIKEFRNAPESY
nr:hypothetical protein Iba_chr06bCG17370 [Ipomoea batatas]